MARCYTQTTTYEFDRECDNLRACLSHDGKFIVIVGEDIKLISRATQKCLWTQHTRWPPQYVEDIAFSPDNEQIIVAVFRHVHHEVHKINVVGGGWRVAHHKGPVWVGSDGFCRASNVGTDAVCEVTRHILWPARELHRGKGATTCTASSRANKYR